MRIENNDQLRVCLAERVAAAWNTEGLDYAVLNGISQYPVRIGRDLDVVVRKGDIEVALRIIDTVRRQEGCESFGRYSSYGLYQRVLVKKRGGEMISLPIDLLCTSRVFRSKCVTLCTPEEILRMPLSQTGPFKVRQYGSILKNVVRPLICGDTRFISRCGSFLDGKNDDIRQKLSELFGGNTATGVLEALQGDSKRLESTVSRLRTRIFFAYVFRHPLSTLVNCVLAILTKLAVRARNRPQYVAVLFTSAGVTPEAMNQVKERLRNLFIEADFVAMHHPKCCRRLWLSSLSHAWRNVFTDNKPPVSEFRVVVRLYHMMPSKMAVVDMRRALRADILFALTEPEPAWIQVAIADRYDSIARTNARPVGPESCKELEEILTSRLIDLLCSCR